MSQNPHLGSALTFCQLIFIAFQSLPSFLVIGKSKHLLVPNFRLKKRNVPLGMWMLSVILLTSISLLNNWAFAYNVPVSIQILIRSAGKCTPRPLSSKKYMPKEECYYIGLSVAMCFGYLFMNKRYTRLQVVRYLLLFSFLSLSHTHSRARNPFAQTTHTYHSSQ